MKLILYKTNAVVPFEGLSTWIAGDARQVFFSHQKPFEDEEAMVKVAFPWDKTELSDKHIFFIPEQWREGLHTLLQEKYPDVTWQENGSPQKPPKEEIAKGWSEELAKFYEEEVQVMAILQSVVNNNHETPTVSSSLSKENEQEDIAIEKRIFNTIKKLPVIIAVVVAVLILLVLLLPQVDIETLKQRQIPVMLNKAKQNNPYEKQYWCERGYTVNPKKEVKSELDMVCKNDPIPKLTNQPSPKLPSEEEIKRRKQRISDLKNQAEDAMARGWYTTKKTIKNNQIVELGSAFWYVKQIWDIPSDAGIQSLQLETTQPLLKELIVKYRSLDRLDRKENIKKICDFIRNKNELNQDQKDKEDWQKECTSPTLPPSGSP